MNLTPPERLDRYHVECVAPVQLPLVNKFYKACRYSAKAVRGDQVLALKGAQGMVAAVRLEPKADGWCFLRSMCVAPDLRGQGLGTELLHAVERFLGLRPCYCFPFDHLQTFYRQAGFILRDPEQANVEVQEAFQRYLRQGRKIVLMMRESAQS